MPRKKIFDSDEPRKREKIIPSGRPVPPPREVKAVSLKVTVSKKDQRRKAIFKLKLIELNIAAREEIKWQAVAGSIKIRLNPYDSPFAGFSFGTGKSGACHSGIPLREKVRKLPYKYSIIVKIGEDVLIGEGEILITNNAPAPKAKMKS